MPLRSYTGFMLVNRVYAERFILAHAALIDPGYASYPKALTDEQKQYSDRLGRPFFHDSPGYGHRGMRALTPQWTRRRLDRVVDTFMAAHPRGKGTSGDDIKREFYAACYALKVKSSETRYFSRGQQGQYQITDQARTLLTQFNSDGTVSSPKVLRSAARLWDELYKLGFVDLRGSGWTFKLVDAILTDRGLLAAKSAAAAIERKTAESEAASRAHKHDMLLKAVREIAEIKVGSDATEVLRHVVCIAQRALSVQ